MMAYRNYGYHPEKAKPFPVPVIGMWRRFFASVVDSVLMTMIGVALLALGLYLAYDSDPNASIERLLLEFDTTTWVLNGASVLIAIIYYVGCWTLGGQTIGKWLAGIKVVGDDGNPPSLAAAGLRYLGYLINNIVFSIGFLAVAFDKRKQGWHDKMANTFVIPATIEVPPGAEAVFVYPSESNTADTLAVAAYVFSACILPCILVFAFAALAPEILRQIDPSFAP
jgi:uncharacterized RDD family membrane protein YckC